MSEVKRRNLGRGLNALLGSEDDAEQSKAGEQLLLIAIDKIIPSPFQPRRNFDEENIADLAESIKEKGILQPLIVRLAGNEGVYEIIAGERRFRASRMVGLKEIPAIVKNLSDQEVLEVALVENLQRQDLSPLEEAEGYQKLIDEFGHTQEALAKVVGKSRSHIANTLRLLNLPDEVKKMLQRGELSSGHARALLNSENMLELANEVIKKGLNVRQTENLVKNPANKTPISKPKTDLPEKDADILALEQGLSNLMGMKVFVRSLGRGGEIAIKYNSLEELDDILYKLSKLLNANKNIMPESEEEEIIEEVVEEIVEEVIEPEPEPEFEEEEIIEEVVEEIVEEVIEPEPEPEFEEEIIEEVVEEIVEEVIEPEPEPEFEEEEIIEEVVEEIVEEVIEPEPEPEFEEEIIEEVVEEIVEEVVEIEPEEDDWAVGLDTVIGLDDEPEEETNQEDAIPDDAWAKALKPDDGDEMAEDDEEKN